MSRKLTVQFSEEQVKMLCDYQKQLVLTRYVQMSNASLKDNFYPVLAWAVAQPKMRVSLEWEEEYMVYAAPGQMAAGTVIEIEATKAAFPQAFLYLYADGYFEETPYEGEEGLYYIRNNTKEGGAFGLAQLLTINGKQTAVNPINGRLMLPKEEAFFCVKEEVGLCLAVQAEERKVLTVSANAVTQLRLEEDTQKTVIYDSGSQRFREMS